MKRHEGMFKPGQSGNPAGRPRKGDALADRIRAKLEEPNAAGVTRKDALIDTLFEMAAEKDMRAISKIMDYVQSDYQYALRYAPEQDDEKLEHFASVIAAFMGTDTQKSEDK